MSDKAPVCVVIAEFSVSPEHRAEFLELCVFDSIRSTTDEPGCHQFDVVTSEEAPESVVLYEIYSDLAAFEYHKTTPHLAAFRDGLSRLNITTVQVRIQQRHYPATV